MRELRDNNPNMKLYIRALLLKQGRDFNVCEQCHKIGIKGVIHHTKYEGATLADIQIVCQKCNTQQANRFLE